MAAVDVKRQICCITPLVSPQVPRSICREPPSQQDRGGKKRRRMEGQYSWTFSKVLNRLPKLVLVISPSLSTVSLPAGHRLLAACKRAILLHYICYLFLTLSKRIPSNWPMQLLVPGSTTKWFAACSWPIRQRMAANYYWLTHWWDQIQRDTWVLTEPGITHCNPPEPPFPPHTNLQQLQKTWLKL